MVLVSVLTMLIVVATYQLNGQLPDNPSCKDAISRQPASFCLKTTKRKRVKITLVSKKGKEINISEASVHKPVWIPQGYVCTKKYIISSVPYMSLSSCPIK